MTAEQTLPITAMLKKDIENLIRQEILCMGEKEGDRYSQKRIHIQMLLPQVHTLEEAQQKKAKEEEKQRIVGILDEMKFCIQTINEAQKIPKEKEPYDYAIQILQEAITRLTN